MTTTLNKKTVLITGGTGSFGRKFVEIVLKRYQPKKLIVFSRDELKQYEMAQHFPVSKYPSIRFFIGDVRDKDRLMRAMDEVDVVIHAAALKQVPTAEYNPLEAIKTNIMGAANIIDAAIEKGVDKVVALSTDKAANPVNLYGATKLCSDKLFIAANSYSGKKRTRFAVVRYGNVVGSRGSVIPLFEKQRETGKITITDDRMTRFLITLEQGVNFVLETMKLMKGGEILVPKIPSVRILDLAETMAPQCKIEKIGIRPGEKLHEVLVPEDDARMTLEMKDFYLILPDHPYWDKAYASHHKKGKRCPEGFLYTSNINCKMMSTKELLALLKSLKVSIP